jgi:hypothetical protein
MCFRRLNAQRWTTGKPDAISALVRADGAPYAQIVLQRLEQLAACGPAPSAEALLCDYCACFIKERTVRYLPSSSCEGGSNSSSGVQVRRGRKHGMHMAVQHVLSGGSLPSPSRPHFLRCLAILEQPGGHPFMAVDHGALGERLSGRKRIQGQEDCVVRWLFEGRPHVFVDPVLAKNMRRWISLQQQQQQQQQRRQQEDPATAAPLCHHHYYHHNNHSGDHGGSGAEEEEEGRRRRRRAPAVRTPMVMRMGAPPSPPEEKEEEEEAPPPHPPHPNTTVRAWDAPLPEACRLCVRRPPPPSSSSGAGADAAAAAADDDDNDNIDDDDDGDAAPRAPSSYAGTLAFGDARGAMEAALLEVERESADTVLEPDLCVYCLRCHRVATISFEYSRALRSLLGLPTTAADASADAYYARQVALFYERRAPLKKAPVSDDYRCA